MKTRNRISRPAPGVKCSAPQQTAASIDVREFEQLTAAGETVEHLAVPSFLRRIPYSWHIDDITRYGDKVGRVAEAMQLSYLTTIHPALGMIRVFPLPLLQRVYELIAPQFGWPAISESEALLEDGRRAQRETLKKNERTDHLLQEITERADNVEVLAAASEVREFLKAETARLKQELVERVAVPAVSAE